MSDLRQLDDVLLDRFQIFAWEEGGHGIVYFVEDLRDGGKYAAKTLKPGLAARGGAVERFRKELLLASQLEPHENVLVPEFVEVIGDLPFMFSRYIDGGRWGDGNLRTRIGHLDARQAGEVAWQVVTAMEHLYQKASVVHLDLKPENILMTHQGQALVSDFGISRTELRFGNILGAEPAGTWAYAAPEHLAGGVVDTRSDVFSFGTIFLEMLAGRHPAEMPGTGRPRGREQWLQFHRDHKLSKDLYWQPPEGIPSDFAEAISGCLEFHQPERMNSFVTVRRCLERCQGLPPQEPVPKPSGYDPLQPCLDLQRLGEHGKALTCFNHLLKKDPGSCDVALAACDSLEAQGMHKEALGLLEYVAGHCADPRLARRRAQILVRLTDGGATA